jgi:hypothetical protein
MITTEPYDMTERLVEVPVTKEVRDTLKHEKGYLSYDQFFRRLLTGEITYTGGQM